MRLQEICLLAGVLFFAVLATHLVHSRAKRDPKWEFLSKLLRHSCEDDGQSSGDVPPKV